MGTTDPHSEGGSTQDTEIQSTTLMEEMAMGRNYIKILGFHHIRHRNRHGPCQDQGNHSLSAASKCKVTPKLLRSCQLLSPVCPTTRNHHTTITTLIKGHTILLVQGLHREFSTNQTNHLRSHPISIPEFQPDISPTNERIKYKNWCCFTTIGSF